MAKKARKDWDGYSQLAEDIRHIRPLADDGRAVANGLFKIANTSWEVFADHPAGTITVLMVMAGLGVFVAPLFWVVLLAWLLLWTIGTLIQRRRVRRRYPLSPPARTDNADGDGVQALADGTYLWPDGQILDQFEHGERRAAEAALLPEDLRDPAWADARAQWVRLRLAERDQYAVILDFARRMWKKIGPRSLDSEHAKEILGEDEARRQFEYARDAVAHAERMHPEGIRLGILAHQAAYGVYRYGEQVPVPTRTPKNTSPDPVMPADEVLIVARPFRLHTDCGNGHTGAHAILTPEPGDNGIRRRCHYCPSTWIENPRES